VKKMFLQRNAGKTSVDVAFPVFDSSSAVGALLAGLVYNTASLTAYYSRQGAAGAAVAISLVTKTKGTWVSGGFVAVDAANLPGVYELGVPDAAFAAGAEWVVIGLKGAANMVPVEIIVDLKKPDVNMLTLSDIDFSTTMKAGLATKADLVVYRKNVQPPPIHFFMYASASPYAPATGKTVTATRSIDGAAYAAGSLSAVTEIGNGEYTIQPAQADFNGDVIGLRFTASGCRDTFLVFNTK
jgi:hypothetical protein